jgi:hypothetical protein
MVLCEEAIGNSNIWKRFDHINYEGLRKSWQFSILKRMSERIKDPLFKSVVDELYVNHENGFYVNSPPIKNFSAGVINYIVRYAGRPVLAQSRITNYDGDTVTFTYTPHGSDETVSETLSVFDFIKKLIIHIPERGFKMIRYYGFFCRRSAKHGQYLKREKKMEPCEVESMRRIYGSWRKRMIYSFRRDPVKCIYCGTTLEFIELFCDPRKINDYFTHKGRGDPYFERLDKHGED